MPVYNSELYIRDAIDSLLLQTYNNIEIIIINDGSTDNTENIIFSFNSNKIKYLKLKKNSGISNALNIGILNANGNYIARMDADDISNEYRIEKQLEYIKKYDLDIIGCSSKNIGLNQNSWIVDTKSSHIDVILFFGNPFPHSSIMCKSACFKNNHYSDKYPYAEDYELWTRFSRLGYKFGNLNEILILYRIHVNQSSKTHNIIQQNSLKLLKEKHRSFFLPISSKLKKVNLYFYFLNKKSLSIFFKIKLINNFINY
jgi:glycosyltransferase involved in cell wall biosynthesis